MSTQGGTRSTGATGAGREPAVLVGVDGSTTSGRALDVAVHEAARRGATLRVVHVAYVPVVSTPFVGGVYYPTVEEVQAIGRPILDAAVDRAARLDPTVRVLTTLRSGAPSEVLLDAAKDADLVVVGTRGLGSVGSAFFGSVSTRLAARSAAPVLVVPPVDAVHHRTSDVVVGVDGSPHGDAALRFALDEAALTGGRVVAVSAWRHGASLQPDERLAFDTRAERDARAAASRTVEEALARVRTAQHDDVGVETFVVEGRPGAAIHEAGRGAGLTVVGSRGRGDVQGMLLGSVSQDVLHHAEGPVAVVHAARA